MTDFLDTDAPFGIGVDIGGTGIKVGLVSLVDGTLPFKRVRVLTPKPATPEAVVGAVADAVDQVVAKPRNIRGIEIRGLATALPGERPAADALSCAKESRAWKSSRHGRSLRGGQGCRQCPAACR